jgi:alpha-amylase/alpha-mannosidase (GH57 family)
MANPPKMKDAFVAIHGHFYQPPRENPWFEAIETEESASPFHDWNERIAFECYRPNAYARIVDDKGKIWDLINNYSSLSFNFGPTLINWLELKFPSLYQKIIEADREGIRRLGHGNAMAQAYNHIIMPLASEKDKETEVLWGMADFEKRFRRRPDAMWLPETAVNYPTLRVLVKHGMQYLILSPFQALKVRPLGGKKWTDVSQGRIDPTQPYRCFVRDPSGKKLSDQFIDIFFYDGMISKEISFGDLLKDGNVFCDRFIQAYQASKKRPQLIHIATDGETYGHHKKFGEMALAYALKEGISSRGFEIINYGAFLKRFPPIYEVEIDEGPKGEGTSWSCSHGVGRWKEDCGCSTGGRAGWNQKWRKPLREALDLLRDELSPIFEREGGEIFKDVWKARNGYIEVILDRSSMSLNRFFDQYGVEGLDGERRIKGLKLLEMQRHALLMYTSCGWFFADLAGLETAQILLYAARAIQLAEELTGQEIEKRFIQYLPEAKSNLPSMGDGNQVYQKLVKPRCVSWDKLVNHFAISSLFDDGGKEKKIFSFRMERMNYERREKDNSLLVLGKVRVISEIIPEQREFLFGLISAGKGIFQTWVSECKDVFEFEVLIEKGFESLGKGEGETAKVLTSLLGNRIFTIRDIFKEEKHAIFQKLIQEELNEHRRVYAELFDKTKQTAEALAREGLEIPCEIRVAAEVTLSDRLSREVEDLKRDFKTTMERAEIDKIIDEARECSFQLKKEEPALILSGLLKERVEVLRETMARYPSALSEGDKLKAEKVEELIRLLDLAEKWDFELRKEEAQGLMDEMLKEYIEGLEKSWWGGSVGKPFPPNLILLAEKLDFNVERFSKMVNPTISTGRS